MKTLSNLVEGILRTVFKRHGHVFSEVMVNWSKIVGARYSRISRPFKISQAKDKDVILSTLLIEVSDSATSVEMSYQQGVIIERISMYFGYKAIDKIKFKIRP